MVLRLAETVVAEELGVVEVPAVEAGVVVGAAAVEARSRTLITCFL